MKNDTGKKISIGAGTVIAITLGILFATGLFSNEKNKNDVQIEDTSTQTELSFSPNKTRTFSTIIYEVKSGDSLESISQRYSNEQNIISVDSIRWANDIDTSDQLKPGTSITIPPVSGVLHTVSSGDDIFELALKYEVLSEESSEEEVATVIQNIIDINLLDEKGGEPILIENSRLIIPGGRK